MPVELVTPGCKASLSAHRFPTTSLLTAFAPVTQAACHSSPKLQFSASLPFSCLLCFRGWFLYSWCSSTTFPEHLKRLPSSQFPNSSYKALLLVLSLPFFDKLTSFSEAGVLARNISPCSCTQHWLTRSWLRSENPPLSFQPGSGSLDTCLWPKFESWLGLRPYLTDSYVNGTLLWPWQNLSAQKDFLMTLNTDAELQPTAGTLVPAGKMSTVLTAWLPDHFLLLAALWLTVRTPTPCWAPPLDFRCCFCLYLPLAKPSRHMKASLGFVPGHNFKDSVGRCHSAAFTSPAPSRRLPCSSLEISSPPSMLQPCICYPTLMDPATLCLKWIIHMHLPTLQHGKSKIFSLFYS